MKTSHLALSLLFVSCTVAAPNTAPPVANTLSAKGPNQVPLSSSGSVQGSNQRPNQTANRPLLKPLQAIDRIQQASGQILRSGDQDKLSIQVMIGRPAADFSTQQLELSRIQNLRAWVEGPGLTERILNLNEYVAVTDQSQQTELVISEVPRGKHRVVTVQGYDASVQGTPPEVAGATLKAVYSSPENSTDVNLLFTWRSTAYAEIIESLIQAIEDAPTENTGQGNSREEIQALLDTLDETALNTFLDAVIFGNNPTDGSTYNVHPDRLDPDKIAAIIVEAAGQIPTHNPGTVVPSTYLDNMADLDLKVRTPQNVPFSNSQIQVQITDPASAPVTLNIGSDTADVPQVVPGTWDAIVKLDGLNGGVSARATLTVGSDGVPILTEGTTANPIILPPVITAIDKTEAGAGDLITLTGDGFDPDKTKNTVKFGDVEAVVISATATELVVEVPAGASGTPQITVTSEDKTSNYADLEITPKIINMSAIVGNPGDTLTLTVTGYNPSNTPTTVRFNGSDVDVVPGSTTATTVTVIVPDDATTGVITLTPTGLEPLTSPLYTVGNKPAIIAVNPSAIVPNQQITVTGVNLGAISSILINGATVDTYSVVPGTNGQPDTVTLTVPDMVSSGDLRITTPNGVAVAPVTVLAPPTITTLTPPNPNQPSANLVLTGSNYLPVTQVSIGGTVLPTTAYTINDDNEITINASALPSNPVLGPVKVTNAAGSATASLTYKNVQNFIGNSTASFFLAPNVSGRVPNVQKPYTLFGTNSGAIPNIHGINVDTLGNIYVTDFSNKIHKFDSSGTRVSGWPIGGSTPPVNLPSQVLASAVSFAGPEDLANDSADNIYIADTANHAIRKITTVNGNLVVQTLARLPGPEGIEISRNGTLYVTGNNPPNSTDNTVTSYVFKITDLSTLPLQSELDAFTLADIGTITDNVSILAESTPLDKARPTGTQNLADAYFKHIEGLGVDGQGRIYIADSGYQMIRRIDTVAEEVTIFADTNACFGLTGCTPTVQQPYIPDMHEIRVDREGNVFIPSGYFQPTPLPGVGIYVVNPEGKFSFITGNTDFNSEVINGSLGLYDGDPLNRARFVSPLGVDFGPDGSLYVTDNYWGIRKIERYHPVSNLQMP